jgi:hypothetical protein
LGRSRFCDFNHPKILKIPDQPLALNTCSGISETRHKISEMFSFFGFSNFKIVNTKITQLNPKSSNLTFFNITLFCLIREIICVSLFICRIKCIEIPIGIDWPVIQHPFNQIRVADKRSAESNQVGQAVLQIPFSSLF